jgi:hypothetical protein
MTKFEVMACLNKNKYLFTIKSLFSQIMLDRNNQNTKEIAKVKEHNVFAQNLVHQTVTL